MSKKHIIWQSVELMEREDQESWIADILAENPDLTEEEAWEYMYDDNNMYFDDEKINLEGVDLPENIIAIADLGLWNGRRSGYKELSDDLTEIFKTSCDFCSWYVDQYGNVRSTQHHHDGTNCILYRLWKPGLSDDQKENFMDKLYYGKATAADISRYTYRLGDYIGKVYGWTFSGSAPAVCR